MMIVVPNFQFGGRRMLLVVGEDEWRVEFKHVCGLKDSLTVRTCIVTKSRVTPPP